MFSMLQALIRLCFLHLVMAHTIGDLNTDSKKKKIRFNIVLAVIPRWTWCLRQCKPLALLPAQRRLALTSPSSLEI